MAGFQIFRSQSKIWYNILITAVLMMSPVHIVSLFYILTVSIHVNVCSTVCIAVDTIMFMHVFVLQFDSEINFISAKFCFLSAVYDFDWSTVSL